MPDEMEAKVHAVSSALWVKWLEYEEDNDLKWEEMAHPLLRVALRSARNEAFEEAAKLCESFPTSDINTQDDVERWHAGRIAEALRQKAKP